jgi:hypothetical protein
MEDLLLKLRLLRDVLETLGEHNGMSVENGSVVVHIKTLKVRFITHKFSTGWTVGVVKSVEKKSVTYQFTVQYKSEKF